MAKKPRKDKGMKKGTVITIFLAFIMVTSILGITLSDSTDGSQTYKGNKFYRTDYGYKTKIDGKFMDFHFYPGNLEAIELPPLVTQRIKGSREVVMTYDPNQEEVLAIAASQDYLSRVLSSEFMIYTRWAFTVENEKNMTVVTCDDATPTSVVIDYRESNVTQISMDRDCVVFESVSANDFLAIKDRVVYSLLGIMD